MWYNEPRLSATYKINSKLNLKSAIGRYYQFVNQIQYDDPYNGLQNFWVFSSKEIPVIQSNHYIVGATYKTEKFVIDVEAYYKDLEGVVEFNPVPYFIKDDNLDFELFLPGRGRMRGIDILIQKETGLHKGWVGYSISRSLHAFPSIAKGTFFPSLNDQPHEIKLVNMVTLGKWHLSSAWMYGSGRPFPEYEIFYFTDNDGNVEDLAVMKDRTNFSRLPDYHRLDLAGAYNFTIGKFTGQIGLSIFNVYGRRNVKTRRLSIVSLQKTIGSSAQPRPQYRDLTLIDFTPSLFFNVQF
jgi:ferric enterobactin receptor